MPRYFFNTEDGELFCDPLGEDLRDEKAASVEAVKLMGAILRDSPDDFLGSGRWRMIVSEAGVGDRFTVEVSMERGEAISDWGRPSMRAAGS